LFSPPVTKLFSYTAVSGTDIVVDMDNYPRHERRIGPRKSKLISYAIEGSNECYAGRDGLFW